jgi:flagellar hook-associated protein 2
MGSPVTLSGFNNIDFTLILNSIMQQESVPLKLLEDRQSGLKGKVNNINQLAGRLSALESASRSLSGSDAVAAYSATSSDSSAVAVSAGSAAAPGRFEIVVNQLARAQVTASTTTAPDSDTTIVANGGTLTIGGHTVTLSGPVTLAQLAEAINADSEPPARASVVQTAPGTFQLVLTGKSTGTENAFTITSNLTGGTGVAFGANAVEAADALLTVNNIAVTSASNTVEGVIPGVSVTLYRQNPAATIAVDVSTDTSAIKEKVEKFVTAFNDLLKFTNEQVATTTESSIGRDPLLRQLRNALRGSLTASHDNTGPLRYLSEIGVELQQNGELEINSGKFDAAMADGFDDIAALLGGLDGESGAFAAVGTLLEGYTSSGGLLSSAKERVNDRVDRLGAQVASMQDRLAIRRAALQKEFIAADQAMSLLKSQSSSLSAFGAVI